MNKIPYKTLIPTYTKQSTISGAGLGLFAKNNISKFDWIGFYPGVLCNKNEKDNFENMMYIMGCYDNIISLKLIVILSVVYIW